MNKKILILEPSVTVQKLFITMLDRNVYDLKFTSEATDLITLIFDYEPDIVLLNAELENPGSFEVVKIIRTMECFSNLPIGMYSASGVPFDEYFSMHSGANTFVRLDEKTLMLNISELAQLSSSTSLNRGDILIAKKDMGEKRIFKACAEALKKDMFKSVIFDRLFEMLHYWTSMEDISRAFLELIAEIMEVPIVAFYILENDGPHTYVICAKDFSEENKTEFFKVCSSDFENFQPDCNLSMLSPSYLETRLNMNKFYTKNIQLSSYESVPLIDSNGESFASIHVVREGNFTKEQIALMCMCAESAGVLFENALVIKKKLFFEKRIRKAFSRFVPEQIIDDLVNNDSNDGAKVGEKRDVAVLFSDIRSFTNISERNKPEVIVSFLNRYFTIMVDIIKKHGGTIDKFIGDAIMAEFGTPVSYEDNCDRAVAAAIEMREALESVPLEDLVMPEGMKFATGIGIHYGDLIVGSIGSKDKTDYSVIGDNVNLASRLEGLTKMFGVKILVSGSVKDECTNTDFAYRYMGDVSVKGKKIPVPIFSVDSSDEEYSSEYKDNYQKGIELYKQGIFNLAKEYFDKALVLYPEDKAAKLVRDICQHCIEEPPVNFDGSIIFNTK